MESSSLKPSAFGAQRSELKEGRMDLARRLLLLVAFFFAVCSLVPTDTGRVLLIWPALSPQGVVITVLSGWITLKVLLSKMDPVLRWTAAVTVLLWLPCWIDYGMLVAGDGRSPWEMLGDGFRVWGG